MKATVIYDRISFYPGVSYRHVLKLKGREDTLLAACTPPHDISGRPVSEFLPGGPGIVEPVIDVGSARISDADDAM